MLLRSSDGAEVELSIVGYEFPDLSGLDDPEDDEWDANWLVVEGRVRLPDGRRWSFREPCLVVDEARELGEWLGGVGGDTLVFTEPNLGFSREPGGSDRGEIRLRVTLSHESVPPWIERCAEGWVVPLTIEPSELTAAASDWTASLVAFPARSPR